MLSSRSTLVVAHRGSACRRRLQQPRDLVQGMMHLVGSLLPLDGAVVQLAAREQPARQCTMLHTMAGTSAEAAPAQLRPKSDAELGQCADIAHPRWEGLQLSTDWMVTRATCRR